MKLFINNGLIVDPLREAPSLANLVIENGLITEIVPAGQLSDQTGSEAVTAEDVRTIDARGNWVVPGLIDLHVHFREPGFEHKEDILSGCRSAAAGGFTTVCCMPNTKPVIDSPEVIQFIGNKAKAGNGVDVLCIGAITEGQEGFELADYEGMLAANGKGVLPENDEGMLNVKRGISGISEDGKTVASQSVMREAMRKAKKLGLTVFSHAEPEAEIVRRDLALAEQTGCTLHFCHISEKESVDLIRKAKQDGIKVTAETAPHYFSLTREDVQEDPNKKMNPPLASKADRAAIIEGLADGTIDAIATDHAPHHSSEKGVPYDQAPNGVVGLETSFAISYTNLVLTGILKPTELVQKMSRTPAVILGLDRGLIQIGKAADLAVIDVESEYEVGTEPFHSKSSNSPFFGKRVFGRIRYTIKGGRAMQFHI